MQSRTMKRPVLIGIILAILLVLALVVAANAGRLNLFGTAGGAPAIVDLTYTALSTRLGETVNPSNSTFEWTLDTYPDGRIGCTDPTLVTFPVVRTTGYKVVITYNGIAYDYRAKADNSGLFACSATQSGSVTSDGTNTSNGNNTIDEPVALIDAIYTDLNTRVDNAVSRDNTRFTYNYQLFAGSDLDCPQTGVKYDKIETWGWKIVVRLETGRSYDYRGTSAGNFWLCSQ